VKIVTLLPHDERFSGWSVHDKLTRFHFSTEYLRFCKSFGWEPYLYSFHQMIPRKKVYSHKSLGTVKIFPVEFRFPLFLDFGNDHSPKCMQRELILDEPNLVHFHNYYLFSFPYLARFVKKKLKRPLTTQLHSYHNGLIRRSMFLPCLLSLRIVDAVFYSYKPEESVYKAFGVLDKAVRVPVPSINPRVFLPQRKSDTETLLYVGRFPLSRKRYAEKSPAFLLFLLRKILHRKKDVKLKFIGDGPGLPYCKQLACKLKVKEFVTFQGFMSRSDLVQYYQRATVTLVPLELYDVDGWFDGAIQESLACGTPVATLRSSVETPLRGTYGFLLSKDVDKAADELSMLLGEPEVLEECGQRGSRFVRTYCTENRLKGKLRACWEELVRK